MDTLDVKIFRELANDSLGAPHQSDLRRPLKEVAKNFHVDEDTIRNRLNGLRESGFLKGWVTLLNPQLLGLNVTRLWFETGKGSVSPKNRVIEEICLIPGVLAVADHVGNSMIVVLYYRENLELERITALISRLTGAEDLIRLDKKFPPSSVRLTPTDWAIVKAILADPRKSKTKISEEVGVSARTVKRRLDTMIEGKAIFSIPFMKPSALSNAVIADLIAVPEQTASEHLRTDLGKLLGEYIFRKEETPGWTYCNMIVPNLTVAEGLRREINERKGVKTVRVSLVNNFPLWYHNQHEMI